MLKKLLFATAVLAVTLASSLTAQELGTVGLRNGDKILGEIVDIDARGLVVRINGQERVIALNDVANLEYAPGVLPVDAQAQVHAGAGVVVLRNGQIVVGRLTDIGGDRPKRFYVNTPGGPREFTSVEVSQIHLAPVNAPAAAVAAPSESVASGGPAKSGFTVPANQPWTSTGIQVKKGDLVRIVGTGDISVGQNMSSGVGGSPAVTSASIKYPVGKEPVGALIARIDRRAPFAVANVPQPMTMPDDGTLFLGINDDAFGDNQGHFTVTIERLSGKGGDQRTAAPVGRRVPRR